jgi:hypothetical protein
MSVGVRLEQFGDACVAGVFVLVGATSHEDALLSVTFPMESLVASQLEPEQFAASITDPENKIHVESFGFQVIGQGVYVAAHGELVFFRMPGLGELEGEHYEWARSAPVL